MEHLACQVKVLNALELKRITRYFLFWHTSTAGRSLFVGKWLMNWCSPTGVNSSVASHREAAWLIPMAPRQPIRSALFAEAQWVGGRQTLGRGGSATEYGHTHTHTLNQHMLRSKSSPRTASSPMLQNTRAVCTRTLLKVAIFLSSPLPNSESPLLRCHRGSLSEWQVLHGANRPITQPVIWPDKLIVRVLVKHHVPEAFSWGSRLKKTKKKKVLSLFFQCRLLTCRAICHLSDVTAWVEWEIENNWFLLEQILTNALIVRLSGLLRKWLLPPFLKKTQIWNIQYPWQSLSIKTGSRAIRQIHQKPQNLPTRASKQN